MKRLLGILGIGCGAALFAACGGGEVVVQAETQRMGSDEVVALQDLEVQLLPYDRDMIFDSLAQAYPEPEPPIPDTLVALQEAVAAAQEEWTAAESRWNLLRDSLRAINERMEGLDRSSGEYAVLFRDFSTIEPEERRLNRLSEQAFARFDALQKTLIDQSRQVTLQRDEWADEAFASIDSILEVRIEALGREPMADTTAATGVARFVGVKPGQWWVHARFELPYTELYWNIPVEVQRGEPVQVRLTRETAEIRRKF